MSMAEFEAVHNLTHLNKQEFSRKTLYKQRYLMVGFSTMATAGDLHSRFVNV